MSDAEADDGVRGGGVMAAPTIAPYRSPAPAGHDGFGQLLQAEWTKFRTVRGWVIGLIVAGLLTAGIGLLSHSECGSQASPSAPVVVGGPSCTSPLGPGGEAVTDGFYFVHQPLGSWPGRSPQPRRAGCG